MRNLIALAIFLASIAIVFQTQSSEPRKPSPPKPANDPSCLTCVPVRLYYHGAHIPVPTQQSCLIRRENLLDLATKAFPKHSINTFFFRTGEELKGTSFEATTAQVLDSDGMIVIVGIDSEDRFLFPGIKIGSSIQMNVLGRDIKLTTMALSPQIFEISGLLNQEETAHIAKLIEAQQEKMNRSMVGSSFEASVETQVRTSRHYWMGKDEPWNRWYRDNITDALEERIYKLTTMPHELAEAIQIVLYQENQHYYCHHDYVSPIGAVEPYHQKGGNRLLTLLLYFNDVEEGGETAFPFVTPLGTPTNRHLVPEELYGVGDVCEWPNILKIPAKKGNVVLFYDLLEEGHQTGAVDQWSLHSGCPVKKGNKMIANKWIRNKLVDGKLY